MRRTGPEAEDRPRLRPAVVQLNGAEPADANAVARRAGAPLGPAGAEAGRGRAKSRSGRPDVLTRTSQEIAAVLDSLRRSRNLLDRAAVARLRRSRDHRWEVSWATETAVYEMLATLGHATELIDRIGELLASGVIAADETALERYHELRAEARRLALSLHSRDVVPRPGSRSDEVDCA